MAPTYSHRQLKEMLVLFQMSNGNCGMSRFLPPDAISRFSCLNSNLLEKVSKGHESTWVHDSIDLHTALESAAEDAGRHDHFNEIITANLMSGPENAEAQKGVERLLDEELQGYGFQEAVKGLSPKSSLGTLTQKVCVLQSPFLALCKVNLG